MSQVMVIDFLHGVAISEGGSGTVAWDAAGAAEMPAEVGLACTALICSVATQVVDSNQNCNFNLSEKNSIFKTR